MSETVELIGPGVWTIHKLEDDANATTLCGLDVPEVRSATIVNATNSSHCEACNAILSCEHKVITADGVCCHCGRPDEEFRELIGLHPVRPDLSGGDH